jgi:SAM-dependent methyltransferase
MTKKIDRDAFGHEVMAYLEGQTDAVEIIEREDGYIDGAAHIGWYFSSYSEWYPLEQQAIAEIVRGPAGGRTLDLGSGAGRVELYLQEQGIDVVGIDNSPLALEVCRQRGVKDVRLCPVTQVGPQLGIFDNILMFGNNWGLMGSFQRARWLLRRFHKITTPAARIIAISRDVYNTTNPDHLAYQAWNRERGRMSGQIRFRVRFGKACSDWFDYLMVSQDEMVQILDGTGWRVMKWVSGEDGSYAAVIEKL